VPGLGHICCGLTIKSAMANSVALHKSKKIINSPPIEEAELISIF